MTALPSTQPPGRASAACTGCWAPVLVMLEHPCHTQVLAHLLHTLKLHKARDAAGVEGVAQLHVALWRNKAREQHTRMHSSVSTQH